MRTVGYPREDWPMSGKPSLRFDYHFMAVLAVVVGTLAIALQLVPGFELILFVLSVAALGGLMSGSTSYDDQSRLRLANSYKAAFESLLLIILAAYAVIEISRALGIEGVTAPLNAHWPGFLLAIMCLVMGLAGLRAREKPQRSA
jgi:hypothetical protein